jgi:ABC-2 type transport system permease protein
MQTYLILARRELGAYFVSWTGYVILVTVLLLHGLCFLTLIEALNAKPTDQPIMELFFNTYYFWFILVLATPVITMRTFALEKFTGTFETLMTAPVRDLEVVLAKFSAALVLHVLVWLPLLGLVLIVRYFGNDPGAVDWRALASTFLGILLLGMLYVALGCFASSLTRSVIIAAMVALALGFSFWVLSFLTFSYSEQPGWPALIFQHLSLISHMRDFSTAVIDTRSLVFYPTLAGFFLFLTLKVVESRRWK